MGSWQARILAQAVGTFAGRQQCLPCPVGVPGLPVASYAPLDPTQFLSQLASCPQLAWH